VSGKEPLDSWPWTLDEIAALQTQARGTITPAKWARSTALPILPSSVGDSRTGVAPVAEDHGWLPVGDVLIGAGALDRTEAGRAFPRHCLNGKIDRPACWNRPLTDVEVDALETGTLRPEVVDGCLAAWDLAQDVATNVLVDISGNEHHFEGVSDDDIIGDFGFIMNGAAGDEIDRLDYSLGTPTETLRLATTELRHSDYYQLVVEDCSFVLPGLGGTEEPRVRADLSYLEDRNGGAVFSVGSINWIGSLTWSDGQNNVSTITRNVIERFAGLP
jgi:hypothetical protein